MKRQIIILAWILLTFSIRSYAQNSEENPVTNSASGFELSKPGIEYALAPIEEEWYRLGLGDGLADVYEKKSGFSHTGYAEMVYQNFAQETNINTPSGRGSELNLASGVVFLGYRMNERLVINSEIRWARDLTEGHAGQFDVNSAFVDYHLNKNFSFRGGVILVPMGMVNEFHGPQEFLGAQRPLAETLIIPTTWNAVGFGIVGHWRIADYRAFVVNGFNAAGFSVFGSRDARDISVDTIKTPAITFRLDGHLFKGGMLGISGFRGKSEAFGTPIPTNSKFPTFLKEAHFEFSRAGWLARAEYAKLDVDKTEKLNPALGTSGFLGVGSRMVGGYMEAGYDFWSRRNSGKRLMPYWRWEVVNPQDALPRSDIALGLLKNLEVDHTVFTYGMEFWPINGLQLKVDYQFDHAEKVDLGVNHFNIAMAYVF